MSIFLFVTTTITPPLGRRAPEKEQRVFCRVLLHTHHTTTGEQRKQNSGAFPEIGRGRHDINANSTTEVQMMMMME